MSESKHPPVSAQEKRKISAVSVAIIICGIAVIVLTVLRLLEVLPTASLYSEPIMAVMLMLLAYSNRDNNRKFAVFSMCIAVAFLVICILALFII